MSSAEKMEAGQAKKSGSSKGDEIASFMSRVVPWPRDGDPGFINLHYTVPNREGMPGRPYIRPQFLYEFRAVGGDQAGKFREYLLLPDSAVGQEDRENRQASSGPFCEERYTREGDLD